MRWQMDEVLKRERLSVQAIRRELGRSYSPSPQLGCARQVSAKTLASPRVVDVLPKRRPPRPTPMRDAAPEALRRPDEPTVRVPLCRTSAQVPKDMPLPPSAFQASSLTPKEPRGRRMEISLCRESLSHTTAPPDTCPLGRQGSILSTQGLCYECEKKYPMPADDFHHRSTSIGLGLGPVRSSKRRRRQTPPVPFSERHIAHQLNYSLSSDASSPSSSGSPTPRAMSRFHNWRKREQEGLEHNLELREEYFEDEDISVRTVPPWPPCPQTPPYAWYENVLVDYDEVRDCGASLTDLNPI